MVATAIDANELLAACSVKEKAKLLRALLVELLDRDGAKAPMRLHDESGRIAAYLVPAGITIQVPPIEDTPDYEAFLKNRAENPGRVYTVAEVEAKLDAKFGPMPKDFVFDTVFKHQS